MALVEALLAATLFLVLLGVVYLAFRHGIASTARLTPQLSLQQQRRKAIVRFLREIQEGMDVISPGPGQTLSYALIRDKVAFLTMFYGRASSRKDGTFDLWRYRYDPDVPEPSRRELLVAHLGRVTFTCQSEGALQIHLLLEEGRQHDSLLTTVRLRNLPSSEELW